MEPVQVFRSPEYTTLRIPNRNPIGKTILKSAKEALQDAGSFSDALEVEKYARMFQRPFLNGEYK